jgi:hypothetical protein
MIMEVRLGDVVRLRKPHPCGGYEWEVVRLGADIGIRCRTCGRRVLLQRSVFEKRVKSFVERGAPEAPEQGVEAEGRT